MVKTGTKILKSIYLHGRTSTRIISDEVGIKPESVHTCCNALKSRALIKKETVTEVRNINNRKMPIKVSYWWIRPEKEDKVKGMLKEAYGD